MRYLIFLIILPCLLCAQQANDSIPVHLREVPRHNLSLQLGITQPQGDFEQVARSGLSAALIYDYYLNKNLALSTSARHLYNETAFSGRDDMAAGNEVLNTLTAGILGSITFNRFQIDAGLRGGIGFLDINDNLQRRLNSEESFLLDSSLSDDTSFVIDTELRFNYYFRRSVQLFFSAGYLTTVGESLTYSTRGSSFFKLSPLEFEDTSMNYANTSYSVGVKFSLGKRYSNGELRADDF